MLFNVGQLVRIKEMSEEHTNRYGGLIHVGDIGLVITSYSIHYTKLYE